MSRKFLKQISEQYFEDFFGLQPTKYTLKKECSGMIGQAYFDDIKLAFYPEYVDDKNYSVIIYLGLDAIDKIQSKKHIIGEKIFNKYDHEFYTSVCSETYPKYSLGKSSSYRFEIKVVDGIKEEKRKSTYYIYTRVSTDSISLSSFIIDGEKLTYKDNFVTQFHHYRKSRGPKISQTIMKEKTMKLTAKNLQTMESIAYRNYVYTLDYYDRKISEYLPDMSAIYKMDVDQLKYTIDSAKSLLEMVAY